MKKKQIFEEFETLGEKLGLRIIKGKGDFNGLFRAEAGDEGGPIGVHHVHLSLAIGMVKFKCAREEKKEGVGEGGSDHRYSDVEGHGVRNEGKKPVVVIYPHNPTAPARCTSATT